MAVSKALPEEVAFIFEIKKKILNKTSQWVKNGSEMGTGGRRRGRGRQVRLAMSLSGGGPTGLGLLSLVFSSSIMTVSCSQSLGKRWCGRPHLSPLRSSSSFPGGSWGPQASPPSILFKDIRSASPWLFRSGSVCFSLKAAGFSGRFSSSLYSWSQRNSFEPVAELDCVVRTRLLLAPKRCRLSRDLMEAKEEGNWGEYSR